MDQRTETALEECRCEENGIPEWSKCNEYTIKLFGKCEFNMGNHEFAKVTGAGMKDKEYFE